MVWLRLFFVSIWLVCGAGLADAQTTPVPADDDPLMGTEEDLSPSAVPAVPATGNFRQVLVIGDNLAGGLGAGLSRLGETGVAPLAVTNRFNEASGLARPDFYDWPLAITKITEGKSFTDAVILIGVNDRREFRSSQGRFVFGTPEWQQAYAAQIDAVVTTFKGRGIAIYWVGLPPMADPEFDTAVQQMNALAQARVTAAGGNYVDLRPAFLNPDGSWADRGLDETGVSRRMRSRNGVTFFKMGNNKMARVVLDAMLAKSSTAPAIAVAPAEAGNAVPAAQTAPAIAGVPAVAADTGPLLGESGNSGEEVVTDSRDIKVAVASQPAAPEPLVKSNTTDFFSAVSGSAAEKLFTTGEVSSVPAGRSDDFTVQLQ